MKLMTKEILSKIPPLYSQEKVKDPMVWVKFFHPMGSWTWYAIEYRPSEKLFFGWSPMDGELGYASLAEMEATKVRGLGIERDLHFKPRPLSEVKKLHQSNPGMKWHLRRQGQLESLTQQYDGTSLAMWHQGRIKENDYAISGTSPRIGNPAYDSSEAIEEARAIVAKLKKEYSKGKGKLYHLGSMEAAEKLGLPSLHSVKALEHAGYGDFYSRDKKWDYIRIRDTDAGRIYLKAPRGRNPKAAAAHWHWETKTSRIRGRLCWGDQPIAHTHEVGLWDHGHRGLRGYGRTKEALMNNEFRNPTKPAPHTQVKVSIIPKCDFCDSPALYDGKTGLGPWANMCQVHFSEWGVGLGLGKGQRLIKGK